MFLVKTMDTATDVSKDEGVLENDTPTSPEKRVESAADEVVPDAIQTEDVNDEKAQIGNETTGSQNQQHSTTVASTSASADDVGKSEEALADNTTASSEKLVETAAEKVVPDAIQTKDVNVEKGQISIETAGSQQHSTSTASTSTSADDVSHDEEAPEDDTAPSAEKRVETVTEDGNVKEAQRSNETTGIQSQQHSSPAASTSASAVTTQQLNEKFDEYFKKFLEAEPSQLDDHDIRRFEHDIPMTYVVPEDRHPILFKALFKIKEIESKSVYNDSLSLIKKLFINLDFNKFLLQFWNCDEFKDRELGPVGYSFTEGHARYDFSGVVPINNDIVTINAKAVDAAWSMLLDVEATVKLMLDTYMNDKPMSVFYLIILRRFKCLGDYKLRLDGKETPLFMYFMRKVTSGLEGHRLNIALSCLVSVCWSPKGHYCWSLMKPNYALCEIMNHLVRDDENHGAYMLALRRLFTPISGFRCDIKWSSDSKDFDNATLFLFHFIKYYNRKQSVGKNNEIFFILSCFKTSLQHFGNNINNFGALEECVDVDWPFAYHALNFLNVQGIKRQLPESIFKALPEADVDKFISLDESEPSLQKAFTGLTELYFLCDRNYQIPEFNVIFKCNYQIPDAFYKNLWSTHSHPKSVIDLFGRSIVQAYNNLKSSVNIVVDKRFVDFVSRISQYCLDYDLVESFSSSTELNFDFITRSTHLIIIGRTLRLIIEDHHNKNGRKPAYRDLPNFFFDLFKVFSMKTRDKFADIRTVNQGLWAPWRKGAAACMEDERSMAINHFLNGIQKEVFCMFDGVFQPEPELIELLFFLHKQRRYHGLNYPRVEELLRETYPYAFESAEPNNNRGSSQRYQANRPSRQDQDDTQPDNSRGPAQRFQGSQPSRQDENQSDNNRGSTQRGPGNRPFRQDENQPDNSRGSAQRFQGQPSRQDENQRDNNRGSTQRGPGNRPFRQDQGDTQRDNNRGSAQRYQGNQPPRQNQDHTGPRIRN